MHYLETACLTGQNDRQTQILSRQIVILAGHCPVTGRYFEPWVFDINNFQSAEMKSDRLHVHVHLTPGCFMATEQAKGFINVFRRRATGFYRQAGLFLTELLYQKNLRQAKSSSQLVTQPIMKLLRNSQG